MSMNRIILVALALALISLPTAATPTTAFPCPESYEPESSLWLFWDNFCAKAGPELQRSVCEERDHWGRILQELEYDCKPMPDELPFSPSAEAIDSELGEDEL